MHTEDEARKLWCPMVRFFDHGKTHAFGPFNRLRFHGTTGDVADTCRCIASRCAMWRWAYAEGAITNREGYPTGEHVSTKSDHGYCGIAGHPYPLFVVGEKS